MAGYVIVNYQISDETVYARFKERVGATVEAHGGRYLVRDGDFEVFDGDWHRDHIVVIEFDSVERARGWLNSPEFSELREIAPAPPSPAWSLSRGSDRVL